MSISRWGKSFVVLLATTFVLSNVPIRKDNSVRAATVINHNNDQTQETNGFQNRFEYTFFAVFTEFGCNFFLLTYNQNYIFINFLFGGD